MATPTAAPEAVTGLRAILTDGASTDLREAPPPATHRELVAGIRATLPFAISVVPFMSIYGLLMRQAGIPAWTIQAMSVLVFSGAQLVVAQMLVAGAPAALIVATGATMNARHLLYSASIAPYLRRLPFGWRLLLAYLLTDETYLLSMQRYQQSEQRAYRQWFLLGAGVMMWIACQVGTAIGSLVGSAIPAGWSLDFLPTLVFIALLVEAIKDRATLLAACSAGVLATLAAGMPLKLSLIAASLVGIAAGVVFEIRAARMGGRVQI